MKWRGETEKQWLHRTAEWHRYFCILPQQMRNGSWVWLSPVWCIRRTKNMGYYFEFSDAVSMPVDAPRPQRPPPPAPMRKR